MAISKAIYSWTESASYAVDAMVAGEAIAKLKNDVGEDNLPHRLVEEAASQAHPLHGLFQWDDDKAAHAYRVQQARRVISSLRVVVKPGMPAAPAFFSIRVERQGEPNERQVHVETRKALVNAATRDAVIRAELSRLLALLARTAMFEEFGPIRYAAKQVEATLNVSTSQAAD